VEALVISPQAKTLIGTTILYAVVGVAVGTAIQKMFFSKRTR
jgi:hypothetical protein